MTIKIIKEGKTTKFTKTCPYCGCEFEYGQEDIKINSNFSVYDTYVICPCCGKHLSHNDYIAYYNNPNKPNPKYTIRDDSPCDWYIKYKKKFNI